MLLSININLRSSRVKMSDLYSVVITGELIKGFEQEAVKSSFAELFKLEQQKAQSYFTGKPKVLKRLVDHQTANKYRTRIERLGALVELRKVAAVAAPQVESEHTENKITNSHVDPRTESYPKNEVNPIEAGRLNQIRKMESIELAQESKNIWMVILGVICVLFAVADFGLNYLNITTLTAAIWGPIITLLVGAVFIKSSSVS